MAGVPAVKNEARTFGIYLTSQANTNIFQVNPTLAAGDITGSTDGVAFGNVASATVTPAGGRRVEITLSAAQMNGDVISWVASDQAGAEWQDLAGEFSTDTQQIGDIPTAAAIAVAVWAAATRTLTSISAIASDIWGYATRTLTQSAAQVAAAVSGEDITVQSYATWDIDLTGIGDISDRTALYFVAKGERESEADSSAIVSIEETLGLLYIGGAAAAAAADGSITVTDAVAGDITITVSAAETGIVSTQGWYGVKKVSATAVTLMCEGWFRVEAPSPRALA